MFKLNEVHILKYELVQLKFLEGTVQVLLRWRVKSFIGEVGFELHLVDKRRGDLLLT